MWHYLALWPRLRSKDAFPLSTRPSSTGVWTPNPLTLTLRPTNSTGSIWWHAFGVEARTKDHSAACNAIWSSGIEEHRCTWLNNGRKITQRSMRIDVIAFVHVNPYYTKPSSSTLFIKLGSSVLEGPHGFFVISQLFDAVDYSNYVFWVSETIIQWFKHW